VDYYEGKTRERRRAKKVWERTQEACHFQQHFKLIFKSVFN